MDQDWEAMLRAVMGDAAAEEIIASLKAQGIDPARQLDGMITSGNFDLVVNQIRSMLGSSGEGPVNWQVAERVARETVLSKHFDRISGADGERARIALSTASLWLDAATDLDPATGPNLAWSRLDWVAHSLPTMKKLLDPVGENIARAFRETIGSQLEEFQGQLPEGMSPLPGFDPTKLMSGLIASMLGMQYGQALAELAVSSFGTSDTGIPLIEGNSPALVPTNIAEFGAELEVPVNEVELFIAVREAAAARLYTRVTWLRPRVLDSIAEFASGIEIDMSSIEDQVRNLEINSPADMQNLDMRDVFNLELGASQQEALARLEHVLTLIEGWVSEVSARAVAPHLPNMARLQEVFARRYATSNPARHVWKEQMGITLAPKRLREAEAFWRMAMDTLGMDGRDALWNHPDLLPNPDALDDPELFFTGTSHGGDKIEAELDSFLDTLFGGDAGEGPHEPKFGDEK